MISDVPISVGSDIFLEFGIAGVQRLVKAHGKVVRHFDTPEAGFGVQFTRFKPHSRKRLERAMEGLVKA